SYGDFIFEAEVKVVGDLNSGIVLRGGGGSVSIRNVRIISENAGDQIQGISIPEVSVSL
ncbi:MAG: hypothetical protein HOA81_09580, partial [Opitutales bacterium]|nr:hypothetical protein [Opitutales bacterium]